MANLNKVMLIGRLTRDPEMRTFTNGGRMAAFGFAVNNRKKNQQTGQWEDEPVFLDCKAFNRESGRKLADLVEQYLSKGNQAFIEGHLQLEQWVGKEDGQKRSKLVIIVDSLEFLEQRRDGQGGGTRQGGYSGQQSARRPQPHTSSSDYGDEGGGEGHDDPPLPSHPNDEQIPF